MNKILVRYLASQMIPPFILSIVFFVTFLLTFQLFRIIRLVISKDVDILTVFAIMGHISVSFLPMAIPLSILFATIYTLNKLSEDSEIIAMRSFGFSKWMLFFPFLTVGILASVVIFSLNRNIIPHSKSVFKEMIIKIGSRGILTDIKSGQFFIDIPHVTLFSESFSKKTGRLEDIFLHINKGAKDEKIIAAQTGTLIKDFSFGKDNISVRLNLNNGNIIQWSEKESKFEKIIFKTYDFPIVSDVFRGSIVTKDSMRSSRELAELIRKRNLEMGDAKDDKSLVKSKIEFWSRYNTPLQCLVFIFLGFSLGIKQGRGRGSGSGRLVLLILIIYYSIFFFGVSLARKNIVSPEIVVFLPTVIAFLVAMQFFRKLDWRL